MFISVCSALVRWRYSPAMPPCKPSKSAWVVVGASENWTEKAESICVAVVAFLSTIMRPTRTPKAATSGGRLAGG